jgi:hypothetical protein
MISKSLACINSRTAADKVSTSNDANGSATSRAVKFSVKTRPTDSDILAETMYPPNTVDRRAILPAYGFRLLDEPGKRLTH